MGNILSAIHDDIDDYERHCKQFGERPVCDRGGPDPYGPHAKSLKKRAQEEYAAKMKGLVTTPIDMPPPPTPPSVAYDVNLFFIIDDRATNMSMVIRVPPSSDDAVFVILNEAHVKAKRSGYHMHRASRFDCSWTKMEEPDHGTYVVQLEPQK
jgi:hypothetical protein